MRKSQDFFCRACYTSLVVIDDSWVQVMRANDKIPHNLPYAALLGDHGLEPVARLADHRCLTGPLSAS